MHAISILGPGGVAGMPLVAFDLDGTLEDSRDDMVAAVLSVRAQLSLPTLPGAGFRPHVNRGMAHLYQTCFSEMWNSTVDEAVHRSIQSAYVREYGENIAVRTKLYDGIGTVLSQLQPLAKLAVVTNKPEALSVRLLTALDVLDKFSAVIGGDSASRAKPAADPLREAVRRAEGTGPVIMIGDSPGDIACAAAFGCPVIWCAWGYGKEYGPAAPSYIAESPTDIPAILENIFQRS